MKFSPKVFFTIIFIFLLSSFSISFAQNIEEIEIIATEKNIDTNIKFDEILEAKYNNKNLKEELLKFNQINLENNKELPAGFEIFLPPKNWLIQETNPELIIYTLLDSQTLESILSKDNYKVYSSEIDKIALVNNVKKDELLSAGKRLALSIKLDLKAFTETKEYLYDDFIKILVNEIKLDGENLLKKHYAHFVFMLDRSKSVNPITYTKWRTELFGRLLEDFLIEKDELSKKNDKLTIAPFRLNSKITLYGEDYKRKEPYKDLYLPKGYEDGEGTDYITSLVEVLDKLEKDGTYKKENIIIILVTDEHLDKASPLQDKLIEFKNKNTLNYYCEHYNVKLDNNKEEEFESFTVSIYYNNFPEKTIISPNRYEIINNQGGKSPVKIATPTSIPTVTPVPTVTPTPTPTPTPTSTPTATSTPTPTPTPKPLMGSNNSCCMPLIAILLILLSLGIYMWLLRDKTSYRIKTDKGEEATLTFRRKKAHNLKNPPIGQLRLYEPVFLIRSGIALYPEKDYIIRDSSGKEATRASRRRKSSGAGKGDGALLERLVLKISERGVSKENKFTYKKKEEGDAWEEIIITVIPKKKEKKQKKTSRRAKKFSGDKKDNN